MMTDGRCVKPEDEVETVDVMMEGGDPG